MTDHFLESAVSSIGLFPALVNREGVDIPRDRYGDGWNEALKEIILRWEVYLNWYRSLSPEEQSAVDSLFNSGRFCLDLDNNKVLLSITMNDVFVPAAVEESIETIDLVPLSAIYHKYGDEGIIAWMSPRYSCHPRVNISMTKYQAALKNLYAT